MYVYLTPAFSSLGMCLAVKLLSYGTILWKFFEELVSKVAIYHFTFPPAAYKSSHFSTSLTMLTFLFLNEACPPEWVRSRTSLLFRFAYSWSLLCLHDLGNELQGRGCGRASLLFVRKALGPLHRPSWHLLKPPYGREC